MTPLEAVLALLEEHGGWEGTATELCEALPGVGLVPRRAGALLRDETGALRARNVAVSHRILSGYTVYTLLPGEDSGRLADTALARDPVPPPVLKRRGHPKGWEPGLVWDGSAGEIVTATATATPPAVQAVLKEDGFDPDEIELVGNVEHRKWQQTPGGDFLHYWKYRIEQRHEDALDPEDVSALLDRALTRPAFDHWDPQPWPGNEVFLFAPADLQAGKAEAGGHEAMVDRFQLAVSRAQARVHWLRARGDTVDDLVIALLGDLVENCDGHYDMQTFTTTLNRRDQARLVRRLILYALDELAPLFRTVRVVAVPGNHGENRKGGKAFTDWADNDDVAIPETVAEIAARDPSLQHVSFVIPQDELTVTLDLAGTVTTFVHGHQFKATRVHLLEGRAESWWARQAHTQHAAGDSTLLLSGHFHHFRATDFGPKHWIQAPSLDGQSLWYEHTNGSCARPGILSLVVGGGSWHDLEIL